MAIFRHHTSGTDEQIDTRGVIDVVDQSGADLTNASGVATVAGAADLASTLQSAKDYSDQAVAANRIFKGYVGTPLPTDRTAWDLRVGNLGYNAADLPTTPTSYPIAVSTITSVTTSTATWSSSTSNYTPESGDVWIRVSDGHQLQYNGTKFLDIDSLRGAGDGLKIDSNGNIAIAEGGVTKAMTATAVQTSLGKADTALQSSNVDQTYSATSTNPQSGVAVAEAVASVVGGVPPTVSDTSGNETVIESTSISRAIGTLIDETLSTPRIYRSGADFVEDLGNGVSRNFNGHGLNIDDASLPNDILNSHASYFKTMDVSYIQKHFPNARILRFVQSVDYWNNDNVAKDAAGDSTHAAYSHRTAVKQFVSDALAAGYYVIMDYGAIGYPGGSMNKHPYSGNGVVSNGAITFSAALTAGSTTAPEDLVNVTISADNSPASGAVLVLHDASGNVVSNSITMENAATVNFGFTITAAVAANTALTLYNQTTSAAVAITSGNYLTQADAPAYYVWQDGVSLDTANNYYNWITSDDNKAFFQDQRILFELWNEPNQDWGYDGSNYGSAIWFWIWGTEVPTGNTGHTRDGPGYRASTTLDRSGTSGSYAYQWNPHVGTTIYAGETTTDTTSGMLKFQQDLLTGAAGVQFISMDGNHKMILTNGGLRTAGFNNLVIIGTPLFDAHPESIINGSDATTWLINDTNVAYAAHHYISAINATTAMTDLLSRDAKMINAGYPVIMTELGWYTTPGASNRTDESDIYNGVYWKPLVQGCASNNGHVEPFTAFSYTGSAWGPALTVNGYLDGALNYYGRLVSALPRDLTDVTLLEGIV
jgi:hypothetical protein